MRRRNAVYLLVAWGALVAVATHFTASLLMRWLAASSGFVGAHGWRLLVNWKTAAFLFLTALVLVSGHLLLRLAALRGLTPSRARVAVLGSALIVVFVHVGLYVLVPDEFGGANRWGFRRNWPASSVCEISTGWSGFPMMRVETNSHAYRDDEWIFPTTDDGTRRVLLVGDSHVFGHGIPDKSGLLDTQMEVRLNAGGGPRWDVWNIANHPAALRYYAEVVPRVVPDARPRYVVLSVFPDDISFADEQMAMSDKSAWFYNVAESVDLFGDLIRMRQGIGWTGFDPEAYQSDPDVVAVNREAFERLLAFARGRALPLVVWEALGPISFFDPYRGREGLTFVDWRTEVGLDCSATNCLWGNDPTLAYPDGHPLPRTNGLIADAIVRTLRRLEAK